MDLRPKDASPSYSELTWWAAYRAIVPALPEQLKWMEARIIGLHAGKAPAAVYFDPFHQFHDPEWQDEEVDRLREINRKNRKEKKAKSGKCQD